MSYNSRNNKISTPSIVSKKCETDSGSTQLGSPYYPFRGLKSIKVTSSSSSEEEAEEEYQLAEPETVTTSSETNLETIPGFPTQQAVLNKPYVLCHFELRDEFLEDILPYYKHEIIKPTTQIKNYERNAGFKLQLADAFSTFVYFKLAVQIISACDLTYQISENLNLNVLIRATPPVPVSMTQIISGIGNLELDEDKNISNNNNNCGLNNIVMRWPLTTMKTALYNANVYNNRLLLAINQDPTIEISNEKLGSKLFWADEEGYEKVKLYATRYLTNMRNHVYEDSKTGSGKIWFAPPLVPNLVEQQIVDLNILESIKFWQVYCLWSLGSRDFIEIMSDEETRAEYGESLAELKLTYCEVTDFPLVNKLTDLLNDSFGAKYRSCLGLLFDTDRSSLPTSEGRIGEVCVRIDDDGHIYKTPFELSGQELKFGSLVAPVLNYDVYRDFEIYSGEASHGPLMSFLSRSISSAKAVGKSDNYGFS
ncbi:unnamed protein product [Ambrosiozyma monospora]|uniref:Unnamed protein product n=1 Tax=Ambrosiozyma monospora TaxID=43982 RepID=A0A9W6YRW8_AMBMO|nr:unnamed protein product [Ambrosiozyma monospora]